MAISNCTIPTTHHGTYDELWRLFYAISGCLEAAFPLTDGSPLTDREKNVLSGVMEALERLAAQGQHLAAEAREAAPDHEAHVREVSSDGK